jgi:outer membrane protein assembly factor BamB
MRFHSAFIMLAASGLMATGAASAAEWRQYRGPNGDGSSGDAAINMNWPGKPPALLWSVKLNDNGWSNPCVAGGVVFAIDHNNTMGPADDQGKRKVEKGEDIVRALDLKTGKELWNAVCPGIKKDQMGYTGAAPVTDGEKLYVVNRALVVTCLDIKTGKQIWQRNAGADFGARPSEASWGFNISPLLDGNQLCLIPGGAEATFVALNKETGETIWKAPGGMAGQASPIIYGTGETRQYVVFNAEGLIGFNPKDGRRLWTQPRVTQFNQNSATPLVIGQRILITSAWKVGTALVDITDNKPTLVWDTLELQSRFSTPVCLNGCIFGVSMPEKPGDLVCLDAATGKVNWKQPGFEFGPLGAAGGAVLAVNGKTGEVVMVEANAAKYNELGRIKPEPKGTAWNNPIVAEGKLLIRTQKALFCYDVAP